MEIKENPMYVSIEGPTSFRKDLLETAIDVTSVLKNYEDYKMTRDKKTKKLKELKGILLDARKYYRKLKSDLPELPQEKPIEEIKEEPKKEIKVEEKEVKIEPPKVPVSKEEDQLTKELMNIKNKLRNL